MAKETQGAARAESEDVPGAVLSSHEYFVEQLEGDDG